MHRLVPLCGLALLATCSAPRRADSYANLALLANKEGDRPAVRDYAKAAIAAEASAGVDVGAAKLVTALVAAAR